MTATTCSELTTFATAIQVFTGVACESLTCLQDGGSNTADFDCAIPSAVALASRVTWESVLGQLVFRVAGSSGSFGISINVQ